MAVICTASQGVCRTHRRKCGYESRAAGRSVPGFDRDGGRANPGTVLAAAPIAAPAGARAWKIEYVSPGLRDGPGPPRRCLGPSNGRRRRAVRSFAQRRSRVCEDSGPRCRDLAVAWTTHRLFKPSICDSEPWEGLTHEGRLRQRGALDRVDRRSLCGQGRAEHVLSGLHAIVLAVLTAVTFKAADGITVYANLYPAQSGAPVVLLFHQAGSSKDEYAAIAPKLNALGFAALAVDQRSGGDLYGPNLTAMHDGKSATYLDALADLEAAYAYARLHYPMSRVVLWGSSYSSDLVLLLAAKHPDHLAGVLSFSPDASYLGNPALVLDAARTVRVPFLVVSTAPEAAAGKAILDASPSTRKQQFVPKDGVHGSSTLNPDRNPQGAAANWNAVAAFLRTVRG
jgi:dienelactone hydrolase